MPNLPNYRRQAMGDVVPAMLEPGEFVINRNAVNALGVDNLEILNESGGAHSAIDELIASATVASALQNARPPHYQFGGQVRGYQEGGFIDRLKNMLKRKSETDESEPRGPEKHEYAGPTREDIDNVLLDYQKRVERSEKFGKNYLNEETGEWEYDYKLDTEIEDYHPNWPEAKIRHQNIMRERREMEQSALRRLNNPEGYQAGGSVNGYQGGGQVENGKKPKKTNGT